jgi:hypothetical protein
MRNIITIVLSSLSVLMLLSTLFCGFWLHSHEITAEGIAFHTKIAVGTSVLFLATLIVALAGLLGAPK